MTHMWVAWRVCNVCNVFFAPNASTKIHMTYICHGLIVINHKSIDGLYLLYAVHMASIPRHPPQSTFNIVCMSKVRTS